MTKERCPCGAPEELVEICMKKKPMECWFVRCRRCGRETAKHRKAEDAVKDWNRSAGKDDA